MEYVKSLILSKQFTSFFVSIFLAGVFVLPFLLVAGIFAVFFVAFMSSIDKIYLQRNCRHKQNCQIEMKKKMWKFQFPLEIEKKFHRKKVKSSQFNENVVISKHPESVRKNIIWIWITE